MDCGLTKTLKNIPVKALNYKKESFIFAHAKRRL
jgi:hypothetical protein